MLGGILNVGFLTPSLHPDVDVQVLQRAHSLLVPIPPSPFGLHVLDDLSSGMLRPHLGRSVRAGDPTPPKQERWEKRDYFSEGTLSPDVEEHRPPGWPKAHLCPL